MRRSSLPSSQQMREKLMFDLEQGTTSLLSFQQAIGGSLSRSARVTQDMDEDDEALKCSSGSVVITVPALNEIVVPAQLIPPAATSQPISQPTPQPTSLPLSLNLKHQSLCLRWHSVV